VGPTNGPAEVEALERLPICPSGGAASGAPSGPRLKFRRVGVLVALGVFGGGVAVVPFLGATFFSQSEERPVQVDIELPAGTVLADTPEELLPFEEFLIEDSGVADYQVAGGGDQDHQPERGVGPGLAA
jgi:multidrug efflux pump subunit AcrB